MNCDKWGWGEPTFSLLDWYLSSGICCSTQVSVLSVEMVGPAGHTSKKKANIRVLWFYFSFSLKEKKWKERTNKYKIVHSQWWWLQILSAATIWILMIHQKKISVIDNLIALMLSACLCCPDRCCQQSMCDYWWTLDRWPVLHMHPARPCSASCRGMTSESRGDYSDSDRVLHSLSQFSLQTVHQWPWPLYWERTGTWDLQDPVLTGGSFITAEQGDCGKS